MWWFHCFLSCVIFLRKFVTWWFLLRISSFLSLSLKLPSLNLTFGRCVVWSLLVDFWVRVIVSRPYVKTHKMHNSNTFPKFTQYSSPLDFSALVFLSQLNSISEVKIISYSFRDKIFNSYFTHVSTESKVFWLFTKSDVPVCYNQSWDSYFWKVTS